MKIDLSIIIPLYNCEKYINECIDSVLDINNLNVEVIVVDDGSTDTSANIVKQYGDKVRFYQVRNGGASYARNIGLKKAVGDYVMFLDADDFLLDNKVCYNCINKMKELSVSMCIFSLQHYNQETRTFHSIPLYNDEVLDVYNADDLIEKMIKSGYFLASPCFRIIERSFLIDNNLYFKEHTTVEDVDWFVRVVLAIKSFCLINDNSYVYRKDVNNSVTNSFSESKCKDFIEIIQSSIDIIDASSSSKKQNALLSGLAYEYCILLSNAVTIPNLNLYKKQLKEYSWILQYDAFPRISYIRKMYHILGFDLTSRFLYIYNLYFAKSRKR